MAVIALLDCKHYAWTGSLAQYRQGGAPTVECPDCHELRDALEWWAEQWHSVCAVCGLLKAHGNARAYAELNARQHGARQRYNPAHATSVRWYSSAPPEARKALMLRRRREDQNKLPKNALPPF